MLLLYNSGPLAPATPDVLLRPTGEAPALLLYRPPVPVGEGSSGKEKAGLVRGRDDDCRRTPRPARPEA